MDGDLNTTPYKVTLFKHQFGIKAYLGEVYIFTERITQNIVSKALEICGYTKEEADKEGLQLMFEKMKITYVEADDG